MLQLIKSDDRKSAAAELSGDHQGPDILKMLSKLTSSENDMEKIAASTSNYMFDCWTVCPVCVRLSQTDQKRGVLIHPHEFCSMFTELSAQ